MWEISNEAQLLTFIYSLALGVIFCLFYDILRGIRSSIKISDFLTFIQDIIYFTIIAFLSFIFLLSRTNGEIRGYVICGILLGFVICFLTISKLFFKILKFIFSKIKWIIGKSSSFVNANFEKIDRFIRKILKNIENSSKKGLKKVNKMLYTKKTM